ncbi:MAG: hypothetical protein V1870_01260 [Candidatus Aenigmatarchaeota archaeon]
MGYIDMANDVLLKRVGFVKREEIWLTLYEGKPKALVHMSYAQGEANCLSSVPVNMRAFYKQMIDYGVPEPVAETTFLRYSRNKISDNSDPVGEAAFLEYTRRSDKPLNDPKEVVRILEGFLSQENEE